MKLDRNAVNVLLTMDDEQLKAIIRTLAARSGVTMAPDAISTKDIADIRGALRTATDEDLARLAGQLGLTGGGK